MAYSNIDAVLADKNIKLFFDVNTNLFFKRDEQNFINSISAKQLPVVRTGMLDTYMTEGHVLETHWHPNATEMIYGIQGEVIVSVINPFSLQVISHKVGPGQTMTLPQGWWHWIVATSENTHFLAIFDNPNPSVIFGSDILRKTPIAVFQQEYGLNGEELASALKPITETVIIGPPNVGKGQKIPNAPRYEDYTYSEPPSPSPAAAQRTHPHPGPGYYYPQSGYYPAQYPPYPFYPQPGNR